MKNNIKNELENIKNGLSSSNVGLECDGEKILVENCNGNCYQTDGNKGESKFYLKLYRIRFASDFRLKNYTFNF